MAIYLKAIDAKIKRAESELHTLCSDMERFCERQPVKQDRTDGSIRMRLDRSEEPPIEWSVRIGEIVYNLRSSLDHLVWQLVLDNEEKPSRKNAFPITFEESYWKEWDCEESRWKKWEKHTREKLSGVSCKMKKRIYSLQPFTGGLNLPFDVSKLGTLDHLCNVDKHRHLHLTCARLRGLKPEAHTGEGLNALREKRPIDRSSIQVTIIFSKVMSDGKSTTSSSIADLLRKFEERNVRATLDECTKAVRGAIGYIINH